MKFKIIFLALISTLILTGCFGIASEETLSCTMSETEEGMTTEIRFDLTFANDIATNYESEIVMITESNEQASAMKEIFESFMVDEDEIITYGFDVDNEKFIMTMEANVADMLEADADVDSGFSLSTDEINLRLSKDEIRTNLENDGWDCR